MRLNEMIILLLGFIFLCVAPSICQIEEFVSINCGGNNNFTDPSTGLHWFSDTDIMSSGTSVSLQETPNVSVVYHTHRAFPNDKRKYCYTLSTEMGKRYLIRASFLYGNPGNEDTYPKFQLYVDATLWARVNVIDASATYAYEIIIKATSTLTYVCLCCALTPSSPFMSTLEIRHLNLSLYTSDYEEDFYLTLVARTNFGSFSKDVIRYPDDPYDRIWDSDANQNELFRNESESQIVSTSRSINVGRGEHPPNKVMQTAVIGTEGVLNYIYRLDVNKLVTLPYRVSAYFAEIEDLDANETRRFELGEPFFPEYHLINIAENAKGSYILYELTLMNASLPGVLPYTSKKTPDSTRGPLLNALEISTYVQILEKTYWQDVIFLEALRSMSAERLSVDEGDPCAPTPWEWVDCSSTKPLRIIKIRLSRKQLKGGIPIDIKEMLELTELWLDDNFLTGPFPDIKNLFNLKIIHIENNNLSEPLPSYLGSLPSLQELYIQNNSFSGEIPGGLLSPKIIFKYGNNLGLYSRNQNPKHLALIIGISIGVPITLVAITLLFFCLRSVTVLTHTSAPDEIPITNAEPSTDPTLNSSRRHLINEGMTRYIALPDLKEATKDFSKKIGEGNSGNVYYGKLKDGKEVAVKKILGSSSHVTDQFSSEVALLSRTHHRNLVSLVGYFEEEDLRMLIYEFMPNGTLRVQLHGSSQKHLDWLTRLHIAKDVAEGLDYLHTGCNPSIIHRDIKSNNILIDSNMRAKISDFGLSKEFVGNATHTSSVPQGTIGYMDPEYLITGKFSKKSDVYSFGVVLLELVSGRDPGPNNRDPGMNNFSGHAGISHWATDLIKKGKVASIIDPVLRGNANMKSIEKIIDVATRCVRSSGDARPDIQRILLAVNNAISIEQDSKSSSSGWEEEGATKSLLALVREWQESDISNERLDEIYNVEAGSLMIEAGSSGS